MSSAGASQTSESDPTLVPPPQPPTAPTIPPSVHTASARSSLLRAYPRISTSEPPSRDSRDSTAGVVAHLEASHPVQLNAHPSTSSFLSAPSTFPAGSSTVASGSTLSLVSTMSSRTSSSNSPLYMLKDTSKSTRQLPYEEPTLNDADFELYANLCREQQILSTPGKVHRSIFRLFYALIVMAIIYFVFVGYPLWPGTAVHIWRFFHEKSTQNHAYILVAFVFAGTIRNILPLFTRFDTSDPALDPEKPRNVSDCCIIIPCHKSAETLRATLPACLAIFKPEQIFVIANGNSATPLDHTADVCAEYGVRHVWVPVGSKITAEFVGVALANEYKYCMLIDDDVILPPNMPLPTEVFQDCAPENKVACLGYTIKSVGANSQPGTIFQQVQDIEYKIAGLAKVIQAHYGSVVFAHGAVALWRRDVLMQIFHAHPGYHISEDWYLGHTARAAGYRIVMNSQVFVETETPPRLFPAIFSKQGGSRAGYGEMSIFKQRFYRWNFFFLYRIWSNVIYLIFSWRLGWRELMTKLWVLGECYDSLILLLAPVMLPISFAANWHLTLIATYSLLSFNFVLVCIFNLVHLGWLRKECTTNERIAWKAFPPYAFLKVIMVYINIGSVYWSIYEYALFFSRQHLRVTESVTAWQVIRQHMRGSASSSPEPTPTVNKA